MTEPTINVRPTRYEVTALPDDVVNNRGGLVLTVEYRGNGRWGIYDGRRCWNRRTREWDHEGLPSGRADAWLREHRFARVMDALETAKTLAPTLTVNGWTVEQAIRMERGEVVTRG